MPDCKNVLCLTGWQQKKDALAEIVPDALHFDYASYNNTEAMFAALPPEPNLAIGWSLGGQLLVRAITGGYIRPKKLILMGAPFQFIANDYFSDGVSDAQFADIRNNYSNNTKAMLAQFQSFIGFGDKNQDKIIRKIGKATLWENGLFWLDELGRISARDFNFRVFPETIIIHGENDKVIHPANAEKYAQMLPGSHLVLLPACAHAPHLHDPDFIKEFVGNCV